jgi:hypothetical protein
MSMTPEQRSLRARAGAHALHAKYDSRELTANARAAWFKKFLDQVDECTPGLPEAERLRRAEHLVRAHMARLALASSRARAKKAGANEAVKT